MQAQRQSWSLLPSPKHGSSPWRKWNTNNGHHTLQPFCYTDCTPVLLSELPQPRLQPRCRQQPQLRGQQMFGHLSWKEKRRMAEADIFYSEGALGNNSQYGLVSTCTFKESVFCGTVALRWLADYVLANLFSYCISKLVVRLASIPSWSFCTQIFLKTLEMWERLMALFVCYNFPCFHGCIFLCVPGVAVMSMCLSGLLWWGLNWQMAWAGALWIHHLHSPSPFTTQRLCFPQFPNSDIKAIPILWEMIFPLMGDFSLRTTHQPCRRSLGDALQAKASFLLFLLHRDHALWSALWSEESPGLFPLLLYSSSQAFYPINSLYVSCHLVCDSGWKLTNQTWNFALNSLFFLSYIQSVTMSQWFFVLYLSSLPIYISFCICFFFLFLLPSPVNSRLMINAYVSNYYEVLCQALCYIIYVYLIWLM